MLQRTNPVFHFRLTAQGMFIYKDKIFQKINGVAMSLPLGLTTATFFLADHKTRLLHQILNCSFKLYHRYADDILAIFDKEYAGVEFHLLNSQDKTMKFILKKSFGTLPFLDIELKKDDNFDAWIWRKSTKFFSTSRQSVF